MTQINAMATLWLWCACKQNQENKLNVLSPILFISSPNTSLMTGWCVITGSTSSKLINFSFVASQSTKGQVSAHGSRWRHWSTLTFFQLTGPPRPRHCERPPPVKKMSKLGWKQLIAERVWKIWGQTFCFYVHIRRASVSTTSSSPAENGLRCRTFASWVACECRTDELWPGEEHKQGQQGLTELRLPAARWGLFFLNDIADLFFLVVFFMFTVWPKLVST